LAVNCSAALPRHSPGAAIPLIVAALHRMALRRCAPLPCQRVMPDQQAAKVVAAAQDIPAGVFGKPLRAIFRFRRQDIQTPPSPLVGKGGRGDEGQKRTGMQKITHLSQGIYP
jgi:hypothetical protein